MRTWLVVYVSSDGRARLIEARRFTRRGAERTADRLNGRHARPKSGSWHVYHLGGPAVADPWLRLPGETAIEQKRRTGIISGTGDAPTRPPPRP